MSRFVWLWLVASLLPATTALAQDAADGPPTTSPVSYAIEDGALVVVDGDARTPLATPTPALAVHASGARLYVAAGVNGALIYSLADPRTPVLERRVASPGGAVTGFHEVGGQVWMVIASTTAVPVDQVANAPAADAFVTAGPAEPAGAPAEEAPTLTTDEPIRIIKIGPGEITLSVGAAHGVKVGDRFSVFHVSPVEGANDESFVGHELVAVVEVVAVKEESALAQLGRGARVSPEDTVEPARKEHHFRNVYPRRLPGLGEVALSLRPLIKVGKPAGGGALCDLTASYWGNGWFADVRLQPAGFGWTEEGNVISLSALAEGGYDGRAFAVGLGVGVATVNGDLDYMLRETSGVAASDGAVTEERWNQRTRAAFALSQVARLGARDGLHLLLYNILLYHVEDDGAGGEEGGFIYGGTGGRIGIPLGARTDLFLEGGGGVMGYWFSAIGVFAWLVGNGDAGSFGLSASAGGAGVWGTRRIQQDCNAETGSFDCSYNEEVWVMGPMVSLGLTYRFGF